MKDNKLIPNTFQHPNAYIDWLAYYLMPEEEKVLNKAIREILGWHNKIESRRARIALSVFERGKVSKETGEQLCLGCGLSRKTIIKVLVELDKYKILVKVGNPTNDGQMYAIQDDYRRVDIAGLKARREAKDARNASRTKRARAGVSHTTRDVTHTTSGVSHTPQVGMSHTPKETHETQVETQIFTPSSGEKPETKNEPDLADNPFGPIQESEPKAEGPTYLEQLREAAGGDPVAGAAFIAQTATDAPMSIPAEAGGQDDWARVADAFCCLQGLALSDMPPKAQKQWPRKLQGIAEGAGASPAQMVAAIRAMPDTELAFKVSGYTTPYKQSFEDDVQMVIAKIAAGQIVPKSGAPSSTATLAKNGYDTERIKTWAQQKQLQSTT